MIVSEGVFFTGLDHVGDARQMGNGVIVVSKEIGRQTTIGIAGFHSADVLDLIDARAGVGPGRANALEKVQGVFLCVKPF